MISSMHDFKVNLIATGQSTGQAIVTPSAPLDRPFSVRVRNIDTNGNRGNGRPGAEGIEWFEQILKC